MRENDRERIAVLGSGWFAQAVADAVYREPGSKLDRLIGPEDPPLESASLAICLTPAQDRIAAVRQALDAGVPVVTLPFAFTGADEQTALESGRVVQVNTLRGFAAIESLRGEILRENLGRAYALFAAHRVQRGTPELFTEIGVPLLHLVTDLLNQEYVRVQVTATTLFGDEPDAWVVITRFADDTVATIEFAAALPAQSPSPVQLLIEATGSDAVLRAEPTRQTVRVIGQDGHVSESGWWADLASGFVTAALKAAQEPDAARELAFLQFLDAVRRSAAASGQPVEVE